MKGIMISALLLLTGCSQREVGVGLEPQALDQDRALREVELLLAVGERDAGTPGAKRAAEHIRRRLDTLGVAAEIDSFADQTPLGIRQFHNVIANIPGRGRGLVVLGSHFDTKAGMPVGFQGANDSGSSTGLLIELARILHQAPTLEYDLQLLFFDGEECLKSYSHDDGLHGSRHHAQRLIAAERSADVKAVIILDMIGDRDLDVRFPRNCTRELIGLAFEAAHRADTRRYFGLARTSIIDDHLPFYQAGMPAINFIDFQFGSRPGANDYWHTEEDTFDKLSADSLGIVGRTVIEMLNLLNK